MFKTVLLVWISPTNESNSSNTAALRSEDMYFRKYEKTLIICYNNKGIKKND